MLASLRQELIDPRADDLRRALEVGVSDARKRETLVAAIYGAIWLRLMLREPLDDAFAEALAMMAGSAE